MATVKEIERQIELAKQKLAKLKKEVTATKGNIKKLESEFKKARAATIRKVAKMRKEKKLAAKKRSARK